MKTIGRKKKMNALYLGIDVLSLAFICARRSNNMHEMTDSGQKDCLSLHFLGWKVFIDERDIGRGDEKVFISTEKNIGYFVRQCIKVGNVGTFNRVFESLIAQKIFIFIIQDFKLFPGTKCDFVNYHMGYSKDFRDGI